MLDIVLSTMQIGLSTIIDNHLRYIDESGPFQHYSHEHDVKGGKLAGL